MRRLLGLLTRPFRAAGSAIRSSRWYTKVALAVVVLAALPVLFVVAVYLLPPSTAVALGKPVLALLSDRPPLPGDLDPVSERSVLLAADGAELATLFDDVNRVRVTLDEVPQVVIDALLAAEDEHFYTHPGINHQAVIRAAVANLRAGDIEQGGSTLTQQLAKNVYLDPGRTLRRKLTEAWYALELEDRLSKDEILQRYLNEAYFGQGSYGIGAAAQLYFGVPVGELDSGQAATLVGIVPSPSRLNPVDDPVAAQGARDSVLDRMVATGAVTAEEARRLQGEDLQLSYTPPPPPAEPFFVEYVRNRLLYADTFDEALGTDPDERERVIYGGGLTVHTTLAPRLQDAANAAIAEVMGDPETSPQATLVTVSPASGAVWAMAVGPKPFGRCPSNTDDCPRTMVNPAAPGMGGSGRQPGSAFKPFVQAAALVEGVPPGWEQRTADDDAIEGCDDGGGPYRPSNYSPDPGVKDMAEALRVSNNVYHAKLAGLLGPEVLVETARTVGLVTGDLPEQCAVALGAGSEYPVAMASGFATFANAGSRCAPMAVSRIDFGAAAGAGTERFEPQCEQRLEPEVAATVTELLQGPVQGGTATAAQLDRPVAGKTGTTDDYRDAWFVGFVPQLSTAAWVGYEQPRAMRDVLGVSTVTGGSIPARLWAAYMQVAVEGMEVVDFDDAPQRERVDVPDFRDQHAPDVAQEYAEDYTFNIERRQIRHYEPAGTVIRQRPAPETRVDAGALVTLYVSNGRGDPPRVPDVVGRTEQAARQILTDAGYEVEVEREQRVAAPGEDVPDGRVVDTEPPPRSRLEPGETVTITVAEYERAPEDDPSPSPSPRPDGPPDDDDDDGDVLPEPTDEPAPSRSRQVEITRVVADPEGDDLADNAGEHVTIATGRNPVDVSGWTIEVEGGGVLRIGAGYRMPADATLDVHTGQGENDPPETYFNRLTREVLDDDGGVLILRDRSGRVVARREY